MGNTLVKIENLIQKYKALLIILGATFIVRLPSLFEPLWYGDESIYLTIGQKILRGGLMYVDIFDHKTPGIYYLTAGTLGVLGESIWSIKFLLMIWVLITLVVFYFLGKKLFNHKVALIATIILAAFTSTPLIEGNIFNSEILMILPISLGILAGLHKRFFLAGVLFSLAVLLKIPAVFDFAAFFIFIGLSISKASAANVVKNLSRLTLGLLVPIILTAVYFFFNGALEDYFQSAVLFNVSYTGYGNKFIIENGLLIVKAIPIILVLTYFFARVHSRLTRKKAPSRNLYEFLVIWLIFSLFGAAFGGRPYEHYLIQVIPAFSLIAAASFFNRHFAKIGVVSLTVAIIFAVFFGFRTWFNPTYYSNFFRFAADKITFEEYVGNFDSVAPRNYAVASFLTGCGKYTSQNRCAATRTTSSDKLYVFADHPSIYFLSGLDPASRFITYYHIKGGPSEKAATAWEILENKPTHILVKNPRPGPFPTLENILSSRYNLFAHYEDMAIYKVKSSSNNPSD